ncbi:MAG: hypothetical protein U0359_17000 [Byssovorax sp.]
MRRSVTASVLLFAAGCALDPLPLPAGTGKPAPIDAGAPCSDKTDCDDGDPCTADRCVDGLCSSVIAPGASCADGDACNGDELCDESGACQPGQPLDKDDGDACTADACDPATGAVSHAPAAIDDGDACTTDACDAATGAVSHTKIPGCGSPWSPTSTTGAPSARRDHTAVWTGKRMIIWGGEVKGSPSLTDTGGIYDPMTDTWTPTSTIGAPAARRAHVAAWTGSRMIVWGGFGTGGYQSSGGLYDPETDTWSPMSEAGAPPGRTEAAAVWTGSELLVWGGLIAGVAQGSGGRYKPDVDAWVTLSNNGSPQGRTDHTAVWTGSEMIIWGGTDIVNWHADGARYSPALDQWIGPTSFAGAPEQRRQHSAVYGGSSMIVWGGSNPVAYVDTGGVLDLQGGGAGVWSATSTSGAPSPRAQHSALWLGSKMMIWGGCGGSSCDAPFGDGAYFTPGPNGGAWTPIADEPSMARRVHTAVVAADKVIVWGGVGPKGITDTGGVITP